MPNKFMTFLDHVGQMFKLYVQPVLIAATPFVAAIDPPVGAAMSLALNAVVMVEQKHQAAGNSTSNGAQKMVEVVSTISPAVIQLLAGAGIKADNSHVTALVQAAVDMLQAVPSPSPVEVSQPVLLGKAALAASGFAQ